MDPQTQRPKRPRHYAAEIIRLPSSAARREALARVPEEWRSWVVFSVEDHFARRRARRGDKMPHHEMPRGIAESAA